MVVIGRLICGTAVVLAASSLPAVVVSSFNGNTTSPDSDFGWGNVGIYDNATAIYLGNRWVITAAHVNDTTVNFPDTGLFRVDTSTIYQLRNSPASGLTKPADVKLFQLVEDPQLPPLPILDVTPEIGAEVWVVGHGLDAGDQLTHWDVSQRGARWIWTETSAPGEYSGYVTSGPGILRWGTNLIEEDESFTNEFDDDILAELVTTTTATLTLLTEFDDDSSVSDDDVRDSLGSSITTYESQAVLSDSGGGLFVHDNGRWKLGGTILSVEGHRDQPDVRRNAIFGNITYYADLATYADEIRSRVVYGDLDNDLQLTVADVNRLIREMNEATPSASFDLDRDQQIDGADLKLLVGDVFGSFAGDANLDGLFDTNDLIAVFQDGTYEDDLVANSTWESGDWNGDLEFTSEDILSALQAGRFERPAAPSLAASVPEPSTVWLCVLALLGFGRFFASGRSRRSEPTDKTA